MKKHFDGNDRTSPQFSALPKKKSPLIPFNFASKPLWEEVKSDAVNVGAIKVVKLDACHPSRPAQLGGLGTRCRWTRTMMTDVLRLYCQSHWKRDTMKRFRDG